MEKSADDLPLSEAEIDVCDECGREYAKRDVRRCRKCSENLCDFCMDLHDCDDEYHAKPPKKDVDKLHKM
jgi:predicted sulfurtransferase